MWLGRPRPRLGSCYEAKEEFNGVVRDGKIELLDGKLPEGTAVQVRVKK